MAEPALRNELSDSELRLDAPGVAVRRSPFMARWSLCASEPVAKSLAAAWGFLLPDRMLDSAGAAGRHGLRLGPDEWLLLADDPDALGETHESTASSPFSLVDVSHRDIGLVLSGPLAATALNAGIPLDLCDAAFPLGRCTRTVFGKVEAILWRPQDTPLWRLEFSRSYMNYVARYLARAIADLDAQATPADA